VEQRMGTWSRRRDAVNGIEVEIEDRFRSFLIMYP